MKHRLIQRLLIQHYIRLDRTAALVAAGNSGRAEKVLGVKKLTAPPAVIPVDRAVKLQHIPASRLLVQAVDVLGNHSKQPSLPFPLGQLFMGGIWLRV